MRAFLTEIFKMNRPVAMRARAILVHNYYRGPFHLQLQVGQFIHQGFKFVLRILNKSFSVEKRLNRCTICRGSFRRRIRRLVVPNDLLCRREVGKPLKIKTISNSGIFMIEVGRKSNLASSFNFDFYILRPI